jgi:hypothetical protein
MSSTTQERSRAAASQTGSDDDRLAREILQAWRVGVLPPPLLRVSEWAEQRRRLSRKEAAEAGPWSNERTPYLVKIMDALSWDSPYRQVIFMKVPRSAAPSEGAGVRRDGSPPKSSAHRPVQNPSPSRYTPSASGSLFASVQVFVEHALSYVQDPDAPTLVRNPGLAVGDTPGLSLWASPSWGSALSAKRRSANAVQPGRIPASNRHGCHRGGQWQ